jgi:hypothetical protein
MGLQDLIVAPIYFLLILFIANNIKVKMKDKTMSSYFMKGLMLKLIGAIGISIIYFYYYGTGDTVFYFMRAKMIDKQLLNNFSVGVQLLFSDPNVYNFETNHLFEAMRAFDMSSYLVVKMFAITNIFCFNSYLANAFIFSTLSYIGIWRLFKMFVEIFPNSTKIIAWSFLFIPSVFFWGSGVLKDNVTFGFLGILISSFYFVFFKKQDFIKNAFLILISLYIIGVIKSYILLALIPAIFAWIFFQFKNKIQSSFVQLFITPILLLIIIPLGFGALKLMGNSFNKFSLENAQEKAEDMQRWHTYRVEVLKGGDGSSYNLGHVDFSPMGILLKTPAAINVAIFRPYLWEVKNPVMLLSALESLYFFLITLQLIFYLFTRFSVISDFIGKNSIIYFMLIFSLIFAFSVGFTSYNFGALSRYRIPLMPFYMCAVLLLVNQAKNYRKAL